MMVDIFNFNIMVNFKKEIKEEEERTKQQVQSSEKDKAQINVIKKGTKFLRQHVFFTPPRRETSRSCTSHMIFKSELRPDVDQTVGKN